MSNTIQTIDPDKIIELFREINTVADIPAALCKALNAEHCVIWKPANTIQNRKPLPIPISLCRLYPFTSTFELSDGVKHSGIPADLTNDTTGRSYRIFFEEVNQEVKIPRDYFFSNNFSLNDSSSQSKRFMDELGLVKVCGAFFEMKSEDIYWAVCLYRQADDEKTLFELENHNSLQKSLGKGRHRESYERKKDFTTKEAENLTTYAKLMPYVINRCLEQDLQPYTQKISVQLQSSHDSKNVESLSAPLKEVVNSLKNSLHCLEVSIILTDTPYSPDPTFTLKSCTFPDELQKDLKFVKSYKCDKSKGLTSYVLSAGKPLDFHDLRNFTDQTFLDYYRNRFPDITWKDSCLFSEVFTEKYPHLEPQDWPPVSFLCVPIKADNKTLGVVRCSHGTNPYFFTKVQNNMLSIVADIIGRWWMDCLKVTQIHGKARLFQDILAVQDGMSQAIASAFDEGSSDPEILISKAVNVIFHRLAVVAHVSYRRRHPQDTKVLELVVKKEVDEEVIPVGNTFSANSAARRLLDGSSNEDTLWVDAEVASHEQSISDVNERSLLKKYQHILFVAVKSKGTVTGLLDFGFKKIPLEADWQDQFRNIALNLARQLAVYEDLCRQKFDLQQALKDKESIAEDRILMTQIVGHQIKSPLANAADILNNMTSRQRRGKTSREAGWTAMSDISSMVANRLPALLGCVRKAQIVGRSMELFKALSEGSELKLTKSAWDVSQLEKRARGIVNNNQAIEDATDSVAIWLGDFGRLPNDKQADVAWKILVSSVAVDQIFDAVVGNAYKYGRAGYPISVRGERDNNHYVITISNYADEGRELSESDAGRCCEKRWRSQRLEHIPGSGLGLWISAELLSLQGGRLFPLATREGVTSFKLFFAICAN